MEIYVLIGAAILGSVAWLYQRAWERATIRMKFYQEIVDNLEGFFENSPDCGATEAEKTKQKKEKQEKINQAIRVSRKLWLEAHSEIVKAINEFFEAVKSSGDSHEKFAQMILLMRKHSTVRAALVGRWFSCSLQTEDIKFHTATGS